MAWAGITGYLYARNIAMEDTQTRLAQLSEQARMLSMKLSEEQNRNNALAGEAADIAQAARPVRGGDPTALRERAGLPQK